MHRGERLGSYITPWSGWNATGMPITLRFTCPEHARCGIGHDWGDFFDRFLLTADGLGAWDMHVRGRNNVFVSFVSPDGRIFGGGGHM
jgi:hypothetical protein